MSPLATYTGCQSGYLFQRSPIIKIVGFNFWCNDGSRPNLIIVKLFTKITNLVLTKKMVIGNQIGFGLNKADLVMVLAINFCNSYIPSGRYQIIHFSGGSLGTQHAKATATA